MVPTVVTDRKGAPVNGLTKEDFEVFENKHEQRIALFEEIKTEPGQIRRIKAQDAGFTNAVAPEVKNQRLTMILLDTLNTEFGDQVRARRDLLKFVDDALQPGEAVSLMTIGPNGLNVINDFTTDPKVLAAAVKKVRGRPSTTETIAADRADIQYPAGTPFNYGRINTEESIERELVGFESDAFKRFDEVQAQFSIEATLGALRQIAESFSGVPGRKSLIWVTGGLPFVTDDPTWFGNTSQLGRYESTFNALNHSQIAVYPLDMGSLFSTGFVSSRYRRPFYKRQMTDTVTNLENLAKLTGGKFCEHKQNLTSCFEDSQKDATHYYMVGYYADNKGKPGWRKLVVRVRRPDVQVRARSSYYAMPKTLDPKKTERDDMNTAIVAPTDFTAVPILVRWTSRSSEGSKVHLRFRFNLASSGISIDPSDGNLVSIAFAAFAKTSKGAIAGDFVKELEGRLPEATAQEIAVKGVIYDGEITVPAGNYTVRFVVRDNLSGRMGTVSVPLDAADTQPVTN
jgi:VWFA-related protein